MNTKDSYELQMEARRARATLQAELMSRAASVVAEHARHGWDGLVTTCRRRLRRREIAEA